MTFDQVYWSDWAANHDFPVAAQTVLDWLIETKQRDPVWEQCEALVLLVMQAKVSLATSIASESETESTRDTP